jgi:proteasome component ECM29
MSTPMDTSATAAQEVEALERILTRLALTEDTALEALLAKLLPRILEKLATPHATVRQARRGRAHGELGGAGRSMRGRSGGLGAPSCQPKRLCLRKCSSELLSRRLPQKTMEILAHINKRVRGHATITLPLAPVLALFNASVAPTLSLVRNFALVYTEMAFDRADVPTRAAAVNDLLCNVGRSSSAHAPMLLRMALAGLEPLSDGNKAPATPEAALAAHPYLSEAAVSNRAVLLAFA